MEFASKKTMLVAAVAATVLCNQQLLAQSMLEEVIATG